MINLIKSIQSQYSLVFAPITYFLAVVPNTTYGQLTSFNDIGDNTKSAVVVQAIKQNNVISAGTGFSVVYSTSEYGDWRIFLVTAKHVVEDAIALKIRFNRNLNVPDISVGKSKIITIDYPLTNGATNFMQFARDNIDIAVIYLWHKTSHEIQNQYQKQIQYMQATSTNPIEQIWINNPSVKIPDQMEEKLPDNELADIFYSGYPLGLHSEDWLQSFTRRCTIALTSTKGLPIPKINPNEFLVDCTPFDGDSGSPVFIRSVYIREDGRLAETHTKLVGVMLGYIDWTDISRTLSKTRDLEIEMEIRKKNALGLGRVAPARYIIAAIQDFLERTMK